MSSDKPTKSSRLYAAASVLIGLGLLLLWWAERATDDDRQAFRKDNTASQPAKSDANNCSVLTDSPWFTGAIIIAPLVLAILLGLLANTDIVQHLASTYGQLLFSSDGYGLGINPWEYGAALYIAVQFGVFWSLRKCVPYSNNTLKALFPLIIWIPALLLTLIFLLIFQLETGDLGTTQLKAMNVLSVYPGQLFKTLLILTISSSTVTYLESYFDTQH